MAGYFNDGTVDVELGEHVFATPGESRDVVSMALPGAGAVLLPSGGGMLDLEVTGQRLHDNLGDAERYTYELLLALADSDPGELGVEDSRGEQATFDQAVCLGGVAEVHAFTFVDMRLDFVAPQADAASEPAWGSIPATPATYGGTSTAQNYQAGGVALGDHAVAMRIEMMRSYGMRTVPRARGGRAVGPTSGAQMKFVVTGHVVCPSDAVADVLRDLSRSIGAGAVDLTGNGNTYTDVILETLRAVHTDLTHTSFEAAFVKATT
jgi:hypothetical protein